MRYNRATIHEQLKQYLEVLNLDITPETISMRLRNKLPSLKTMLAENLPAIDVRIYSDRHTQPLHLQNVRQADTYCR